jgi:thiamine biosynthesis lipoprotein
VVEALKKPHVQARFLMNTLVEIRLWGASESRAHEACGAAFGEMRRLERLLSRFDEASEVSRVNREAFDHPVSIGPELTEVLAAAQEVSRASRGAFDVTCGPWVQLWKKAGQEERLPTCGEWGRAKDRVGWRHLALDAKEQTVRFDRTGVSIDLGGAGKGYAVDRAVNVLQALGIPQGSVDAGGNFKLFGFTKPCSTGVESPLHPEELLAVVEMIHPAAASSSNALRFTRIQGKSYGHLVDPRTGWPARACAGATVLAETGTRNGGRVRL